MRILLVALVLLSTSFTSYAASAEELQVQQAEKEWAAAVKSKDFAKLEAMLTSDLIYAHSTGIIDDKTQYISKMKTGKQNYVGIDHSSTTVRMHGDSAIAHSIVRMHGTNAQGPFDDKLMMIHVWVKTKGKWMLAGHQTTRLAN
jgi:ketosteroid isomerase-like protein